MVSYFRTVNSVLSRRVSATVLAFTMFCGFTVGACVAASSDSLFASMMRIAMTGNVSIVNLFCAAILPFLFTGFAVYVRQLWLLIPVAFIKAFSFALMSSWVIAHFGEAGWMVIPLFLFTDCLLIPLLSWLWLRILRCSARSSHLFGPVVMLLAGIIFLDYRFVSPYLVNLLS